jgi:cytochrome P450
MTATASPPGPRGMVRVSGVRIAYDTFLHGLRTNGPLVRAAQEADIARFKFNRRTVFLLTHPDLVDHVLFDGVEHYHKSIEYELLRAAVGLSLFTDEDESWRRHRMLLNPVLAKRHLETLFDLMVEPIEAFVDKLDDGSDRIALEMSEGMTELTLDVVGSALFGRGMAGLARRIGRNVTLGLRGAERATRLMVIFNPPALLARAVALTVRHVPIWPPPINGLHDALETIDETVWGLIEERQQHPGRDDDLLGLLLSVRDEDGERLPLKRVRDEACTFMLAGHETTANALAWMWYLLALNHEARERMLAEVDDVLGDRRPAFADVDRLQWTQACFLEAMRVFPPAWIIPRACVAEDELGGHRIPKGAQILIPIYALHHDPRFWPNPEVFDPTRFLPENAHGHHRSAYLPFGAGRRVCAGKAFAVIEGTIVTAMMSQRFTYEVVPGYPVVPEATLTLRPRHGLPMIARRRQLEATREVAAA